MTGEVICAVGRALGGEATGLGQLDNIKGFFYPQAERARRHSTGRGKFLPEAGGGMFWEQSALILNLCEGRTDFGRGLWEK